MDSSIWITIGIVCVVVWGCIGWEMYNAPLMPDDYSNKPEPPNPKACGCNECQCKTNPDR
jgi:hypothetical protein